MKQERLFLVFLVVLLLPWAPGPTPVAGAESRAQREGAMPVRQGVSPDIRDIRVLPAPPVTAHGLIPGLAIVFFVSGAAVCYVMRKTKKLADPSPYAIASEALATLQTKEPRSRDHVAGYYSELSGIIRKYLMSEWGLKATTMTTEEFLAAIRESETFPPDSARLLQDVLMRCDTGKFAGYEPSPAERVSILSSAKDLIEQTRRSADHEIP